MSELRAWRMARGEYNHHDDAWLDQSTDHTTLALLGALDELNGRLCEIERRMKTP